MVTVWLRFGGVCIGGVFWGFELLCLYWWCLYQLCFLSCWVSRRQLVAKFVLVGLGGLGFSWWVSVLKSCWVFLGSNNCNGGFLGGLFGFCFGRWLLIVMMVVVVGYVALFLMGFVVDC